MPEMHDCSRTWSPIKCNYSLTPFAPNSLSPCNEVAYGVCLQGHRQKDELAGKFTNFNDDLPESSALWFIKHGYIFSIPMLRIFKKNLQKFLALNNSVFYVKLFALQCQICLCFVKHLKNSFKASWIKACVCRWLKEPGI